MPPQNPPVAPSTTRALANGSSDANNTGFDFGAFNQSLKDWQDARVAREAEEIRTSREQSSILQQSAQLADEQQKSMQFLLDDVKTSREKAIEARRLADSTNPIDTLELLGRQLSDPNGYIRANREARLAEDAKQAAILQTYYGLGQDALQKKFLASSGNLNVLKTIEAIGAEKLTSYSDGVKLLHQNLAAAQTMKDDAIVGLDSNQIAAAITQANQNPKKTANIAGIDVDLNTLKNRQADLQEREYHNTVVQTQLQLAKDDEAHVGDTIQNREMQRAIAKNDQEHLQTTLAIKNAQSTAQVQALVDAAQQRVLRTMNKSELSNLRANNYKDSAGTQYNPDDVEAAYKTRQDAELTQVQEDAMKFQMDHFDTGILATENTRMTQNMNRFKSSTPLYAAAQKYQSALHVASIGTGPTNDNVTRLTSYKIYSAAKDEFDKAIQLQAKLDASNGGRSGLDQNLESMRIAYYKGEPIPQENLRNAATDRLINFKSLGDLFPPQVATAIERRYRQTYQAKLNQGGAFGAPISAEDRKIEQAQAAQEAIEWGTNQYLAGQTDTIISAQVLDPTHPLHGMTPAQFGTLAADADLKAKAIWERQNDLSPEDGAAIIAGDAPKGMSQTDANALAEKLKFGENQQLLMRLDGISPGMGSKVANWWQEHGSDYVQNVTNRILDTKTGGDQSFQNGNLMATAGDVVSRSFDGYAMRLAQNDSVYQNELVKRNADLITFSSNPESAQVAILSNDKNLTDPERAQVFQEVIRPLLVQASQKGLDFEHTNQFIEQQLAAYQPQTPEMKSLMKTVRRDRTQVLESMNTWGRTFRDLFTTTSPNTASSVDTGDLIAPEMRWYKDWRVKNGVDSVRVPYKPSISLGPLQIGGDPVAYEQMMRQRSNQR